MKKITFILILVLMPALSYGIDPPTDTLFVIAFGSSVFYYMLSEANSDHANNFKVRLDSVADSMGYFEIAFGDYRTNTLEGQSHCCIRWYNWDVGGGEFGAYGYNCHYGFGYPCYANAKPDHLDSIWHFETLDTANPKGKILLPYTLIDTSRADEEPPADTLIGVTNWHVWIHKFSWMYYGDMKTCLDSFKTIVTNACDSMQLSAYNDRIFCPGLGSPVNLDFTTGFPVTFMDDEDIDSLMHWNRWFLDTLPTLYPNSNIFPFSFFEWLVETDTEDDDYGGLQEIYQISGDDNHHPNQAGSTVLQDSMLVFMVNMVDEINDYWVTNKRTLFRK